LASMFTWSLYLWFFFLNCLKGKVYNSNPWMKELKENILREIANIPAEQFQRVSQNLFHWREECLHVEHFQHLLRSVNCSYFIPNIISQQAYWFISKIRICLAAGSALAALKHSTMNQSTKVSTFL
jgi:hypothetical protein